MNLTKIISNDELRPALNLAVLRNGYIYATDAHVAIKINAHHAFSKVLTDNKVFDIDNLKVMAKASDIEFHEEYFVCISGRNSIYRRYRYAGVIDTETEKIKMDEFSCMYGATDCKYPDVDSVIPANNMEYEQNDIAINPKFLNAFNGAFVDNYNNELKLNFTGENKAIIIYPLNNNTIEQIGLLMPIRKNS